MLTQQTRGSNGGHRHAGSLLGWAVLAVCVSLAVAPAAAGQERIVVTGTEGGDDISRTTPGQSFHLIGLGGDDILSTGSGDDILEGGEGNDDLSAGGGDDILEGGAGADNLFAGDGDDRLDGGPGPDDLVCGGGEDSLVSPDPGDFVSDSCERVDGLADLALSKSASPTSVGPGDTVSYTLSVTNMGPAAAMGIRVTDFTPFAVSFPPVGCSAGTGQVICEQSRLLFPGATVSWTIEATAPAEAGTYDNTAALSHSGTDPNLSNNFASASVQVLRSNGAPVAVDDAYATPTDTPLTVAAPGVLGNDSDPDNDALSAEPVAQPAHGTLALDADGSFIYTPDAGFSGSDSFTYRARDAAGAESRAATVAIEVQKAPDEIVFASSRTGNGDLYTLDPDSRAVTQLTSGDAVDAEPAWSPDRKRVAFTSTRDGNVELYVMDVESSALTRLTGNGAVDTSPAWSPDGTRIAFSSNRARGNYDIYAMNAADGGNVTRLTTHSAADTLPAWSPGGERIAFTSARSGNGDIYAMDAAGSGQTRLTGSSAVDTDPDWAGSRIAFSSNRHGLLNFEIYVMNQDGTTQTRTTADPGVDINPAFSRDGAQLVFATGRGGGLNLELYTINVDGSNPTRLTNHSAVDVLPDW